MEFINKVNSTEDKTIKYVFKLSDNIITEATYIDNDTGKDIICVSCQTMCHMGCTFCHLTDNIGKLKFRNLTSYEIVESVEFIHNDLKLAENNRMLLISFMGCGEPLQNFSEVYDSIIKLMDHEDIRFGLSTMLPKTRWGNLFELANRVNHSKIPLKVHLSLHYTNDKQRTEMMPATTNIKASIAALEFYKQVTGQSVEIHYTLIKDVNDSGEDLERLTALLINRDIPIKFLRFNSKETSHNEGAEKITINKFRAVLKAHGVSTEYYEPPGKDVGASCGQFLFDQYEINGVLNTSII